jgi:hypothetical protein
MKSYEDMKYNAWRIEVENNLPDILKNNLLAKPQGRTEVTIMVSTLSGNDVGMFSSIS